MICFAVVGEGPTDYGREVYDKGKGGYRWEEGPIFPMIRRTAEKAGHKIVLQAVDKKEVYKIRTQRNASKLRGLKGKANDSARFSLYLSMHRYSYGIFYCDADKEAGKKNTDRHVCEYRFAQVRGEILEGHRAAGTSDVKLVAMVPLKMLECWLLSDEKVYGELFGIQNPALPCEPELIWGDEKDPEGNYPKNMLRRVLRQKQGAEIPMNMETYKQIAEKTNLDVLKAKCSISFAAFYDDFCKILQDI